ncbi:hypothetical protein C8Q74DRAFT_762762 [Fomes fomentarius]|nr:hypothetical protein C8Q74DRAFT_762762 [Fomes fomentarius]
MPESQCPKQPERPTLPSLQDLFPDEQFERLRLSSAETSPRPLAASVPVPPIFRSHPMEHDTRKAQHDPRPRSRVSRSPTLPRSTDDSARRTGRAAPYPDAHSIAARPAPPRSGPSAGEVFGSHLIRQNIQPPKGSSHEQLAAMDLPTYVLSADECPPDDDRRHGCGICHRRFNRPSSLMIHMNSHTGAQPFECPFPGCTRRFSVNSNMRRHYRNHREGAAASPQVQPYPPAYYRSPEPPHPYYPPSMSSPSSSSQSSFDSDDRPDIAVAGGLPAPEPHAHSLSHSSYSHAHPHAHGRAFPQRLTRSNSEAYPPGAQGRAPQDRDRPAGLRPRACTVPGCNCNEAPASALRPAAFQQGSPRFSSPRHR